ncbi:MAG: hypothetical protein IT443_01415 [Phycisphaeraceae bacterium]|nr:hypothetical protein [Phycisphaeraceae bacterium]
MEFIRRYWTQIQAQIPQLSPLHKWLIGLIIIVFLMVGWLVLEYAAGPDYVAVTSLPGARQAEVVGRLRSEGIRVQTQGTQILVPSDSRQDAYAVLAQADLLADDPARAIDELLANQSPWTSNQQNATAMLHAREKFLAGVIARMKGVRSAHVVIDMPHNQGFAQTHKAPSASVWVEMRESGRLDRDLVKAIASWVSGAVAEMKMQDVSVIDANMGRPYHVSAEDDQVPTEALELVQQQERKYQEKLQEVLAYIPGVIVAVNVRIDPTQGEQSETYTYEKSEPLKSEQSEETEQHSTASSGEPGVRSNTGLDITSGGSTGSTEKKTSSQTEFGEKQLTGKVFSRKMGHTVNRINATINVPRSFFVRLLQQGKPEAEQGKEPDEAALTPIVTAQLAQIESQVKPLISAEAEGAVTVHMIPDSTLFVTSAAGSAQAQLGGAVGAVFGVGVGSGWVKPVGLGALALAALGMMLSMVRKATQKPPMPTAQELAGVPPTLPVEDDLIGEVEATETTMSGLEMDEREIEQRRIAEQIGQMVKSNPIEAVNILNRWVRTDE